MQRRKIGLVILGIVTSFMMLCGAWVLAGRIRADREERERHFVSVHFVAMESIGELDEEAPKTLEELMERYAGGPSSLLLKPFRNGLRYRRIDGGFELAEPSKGFVSLFRRDRLIATDHEWPHWEASGRYAWKFPGQTIPPNYLRKKGEHQ